MGYTHTPTGRLYCSYDCMLLYINAKDLLPPPPAVAKYREMKTEENGLALLLLEAYQRNREFEDRAMAKEEKRLREKRRGHDGRYDGEAARGSHAAETVDRAAAAWASRNATGMYGRIAREVNQSIVTGWYRALREPTILYKARALSRILTKKCRKEIAALIQNTRINAEILIGTSPRTR